MRKIASLLSILIVSLLLTSCETETEKQVERVAFSFIDSYFSWHFEKSAEYVTDDSRKWISFLASNISEEDIAEFNKLREDIDYSCSDTKMLSDTTAEVRVYAHNVVLPMDFKGGVTVCKEASYTLSVKKENTKWKVVIDGKLSGQ